LPAEFLLDRKPVVEAAVDGLREGFEDVATADSKADKGDDVGEEFLRTSTSDLRALELLIGMPEELGGEFIRWFFDSIGELFYSIVGKMAPNIGLTVEYLEGGKLVFVLLDELLSEGVNDSLSLFFCLRVEADEDETILADRINYLLTFSLEVNEEVAQFGVIERSTNSFG
jgi:hypothetical protein